MDFIHATMRDTGKSDRIEKIAYREFPFRSITLKNVVLTHIGNRFTYQHG